MTATDFVCFFFGTNTNLLRFNTSKDMSSIERYVPLGSHSLSSDAPGWNSAPQNPTATLSLDPTGPTCWKCKGQGNVVYKKATEKCKIPVQDNPIKKPKINETEAESGAPLKECSVCKGKGFVPPKKKEMASLSSQPGMITRKRRCPHGWQCSGPTAHAVEEMLKMVNEHEISNDDDLESMSQHPLFVLHKANTMEMDDAGVYVPSAEDQNYPWYPSNKGEQLCNLVGSWRILQRVGSHRWTTDDIVTAAIAIQQKIKRSSESKQPLRYLDLGCGNGSVLQMVTWGLSNQFDLKAYGIEARSEAASLARRSLSFNVGIENIGKRVSVIHGDFRDLERESPFEDGKGDNDMDQVKDFYQSKMQKFDLVTGTPPYFRVDFSTEKKDQLLGKPKSDKVVTSAVINQGGMPTSIQSAPGKQFPGHSYSRHS